MYLSDNSGRMWEEHEDCEKKKSRVSSTGLRCESLEFFPKIGVSATTNRRVCKCTVFVTIFSLTWQVVLS